MNGLHMRLTIALGALLLAGLLVVLASCGPGWPPSVTPEPLTEVAQPQAMPSSTTGPIVSLFQSPIQTPTPIPTPWIEPPPPTRRPTPTIPPVPTRLPTPVVTRIPTAVPPIIPLPPGEPEPYTIVYREGSVVRAVDSDGRNDRVVIDIPAQLSRFLVDRSFLVGTWASPAPDGSRLALVASDFENLDTLPRGKQVEFAIYLLDPATRDLRLLVEDGVKPVWSPDGARIAYRSTRTQGLWVVDVATGDTQELFAVGYPETEHQADWFTWSPDAQRIAVVKNWGGVANVGGIWIVNVGNGGESRQVVSMEMNALGLEWSPTGKDVLFRSRKGERLTPGRPLSIWIVEADTGVQRQLTRNMSAGGGAPVWSPDGNWIAFAGTNLLEGEPYQYDLWLISNDGNALARLNNDPATDLNPVWTPDGQRIVFYREGDGIWDVTLRDGSLRQAWDHDVVSFLLLR